MRPRAGNTRPYSIPETLVYSVGADDSAARLFMEDSPLPARGASPSPAVSSKGPHIPQGPSTAVHRAAVLFILLRKSMFSLDNKLLQM